ncbi:hypothetical protein ANN_06740 [Periplaneta americana]|uniref:Uncharacterized protein n=1 Tax=Periplaneta americana TaxID=6978 RepID=A0ABQ8TEC7_PERAM|nr:hypothetical protein ANN_06740 [Periplaneta americana]
MTDLRESGNEPPGSLKAISEFSRNCDCGAKLCVIRRERIRVARRTESHVALRMSTWWPYHDIDLWTLRSLYRSVLLEWK